MPLSELRNLLYTAAIIHLRLALATATTRIAFTPHAWPTLVPSPSLSAALMLNLHALPFPQYGGLRREWNGGIGMGVG